MILLSGTALAEGEDLPDPGMLPDSPFYFLKAWGEGIVTFFTFGDVAKAERFSYLAGKRLAEAKALAGKGRLDIAQTAVLRYQEHLEKALVKAKEAKEKGLDVDELLVLVSEATSKHLSVLADVYERVPDEAKPAIEKAMEESKRGQEEALKAISGEKREEGRPADVGGKEEGTPSETEKPESPENGSSEPGETPRRPEGIPPAQPSVPQR
jgi:hypothetical protein